LYRIIIDCKSYDLQSYILSNTRITRTDYLNSIIKNTTFVTSFNSNANEAALYNINGYKMVIINLSFRVISKLYANTIYDLFTLPNELSPSGNKPLIGGRGLDIIGCVAYIHADTKTIKFKTEKDANTDSECAVRGVYIL